MSEIPDAASPEQLLQRIRDLRKEGGLPPRATTLPALPLAGDHAGVLDLTVVTEQLILEAGGVNMLQMMHLTSFLLDAVIDGIKTEMEPYLKQRGGGPTAEAAVARGVVAKASADINLLAASQSLLHRVLAPLTAMRTAERAKEINSLGHDGCALYRRVLVSDQVIESLGIERSEFDAHFKKRFGSLMP